MLRPNVTVDVQAVALARGMIDEQRAVHRPEHRKKRVVVRYVLDANRLGPLDQIVGKSTAEEGPLRPPFHLRHEGC